MIATSIFERIAREWGTPSYVYEAGFLQDRILQLLKYLTYRPLTILDAIKANSNPRIIQILRDAAFSNMGFNKQEAFGVDAVSPGEVALALKLGIPPEHVLFTGNNCTDEEIEFAVNRGVVPNIDSLSRLHWFANHYPQNPVCVRINTEVGAGHHEHCYTGGPQSKFGIWHTLVQDIILTADHYGLKIVGLHQHIGSGILEADKFMLAMEALLKIAPQFKDLQFVDFGGGLGVPYKPEEQMLDLGELGRKMSERFQAFCREYGRPLRLTIEPGRFLVAESGYLLVQVNTVKVNPDGHIFVGVNSGFNHLIRPMAYDSYHRIINISRPNAPIVIADIVGNICESGDKFAKAREINRPEEGDLLVICTAGAYGYSMASDYNMRPKPPEILVWPTDLVEEIRPRETIEQLIGGL